MPGLDLIVCQSRLAITRRSCQLQAMSAPQRTQQYSTYRLGEDLRLSSINKCFHFLRGCIGFDCENKDIASLCEGIEETDEPIYSCFAICCRDRWSPSYSSRW